jgi:hypothetical protein
MKCIQCGKTFVPIHARHKFCSHACQHKFNRNKRFMKRKELGLCPKCGGPMDYPIRIGGPGAAEGKQKISYCSKCREDFQRRYKEKKEAKQ